MSINLTQKFVYETDDIDNFEKVLRTMMFVIFPQPPYPEKGIESMYVTVDSYDEAVRDKKKSKYVCSIKSYVNERRRAEYIDFGQDWSSTNFERIIHWAIKQITSINSDQGLEMLGDGYHEGFNKYDGHIDIGYRLEVAGSSFQYLTLSLIHLYYGK